MDRKVIKNQKILLALLNEYAEERHATQTDLRTVVIADKEKKQFQVVTMGWYEGEFLYHLMFHFEIKADGKIWLIQNNSDIPVAELLAERGVPKSEIVIGFQPEKLRMAGGFAAA
jgi:hypothetical protein